MSLSPNNSVDVTESLIWNALVPSRPELSDDINNSDDKENENEEEEEDLLLVPVDSEEADYTC